MQALQIKFKSKEAAIMFAERQGYDYTIQEPKQPRWMGKSYGDNFTVSLFIDYLRWLTLCSTWLAS